jgi:hypothetical protein
MLFGSQGNAFGSFMLLLLMLLLFRGQSDRDGAFGKIFPFHYHPDARTLRLSLDQLFGVKRGATTAVSRGGTSVGGNGLNGTLSRRLSLTPSFASVSNNESAMVSAAKNVSVAQASTEIFRSRSSLRAISASTSALLSWLQAQSVHNSSEKVTKRYLNMLNDIML